jgi:ABC-2 type transport system permease protein
MTAEAFPTVDSAATGFFRSHPFIALRAIIHREALRFLGQRGRLIAALVRPLVWLFVFAAGFRAALGLSITPPYQTYITYEIYIVPGLVGMILLFSGMQSSLSLVYDREMGSMRLLLTAPLPRWWLLFCRLLAGSLIAVLQAYAFLAISALYGIRFPWLGYLAAAPAMAASALMLGALGLLLSSFIRQLENFAGVMNFVIFPMFFLSSALYPLWKMAEASPRLRDLCALNPFTHAVELVRFALYAKGNLTALAVTLAAFAVFGLIAVWGYDPARGLTARKA